jgi:PPOX class probable F420-dependent enzyme
VDLDLDECWRRLEGARHGVLSTVHAIRGVDAVPAVFAVVDRVIVIPIDTVKAKTTTRLQRLANVRTDPRAVLLADHYSEDWRRLWWVRAHGQAREEQPTAAHLAALSERYPAYRSSGTVATTIVLTPELVRGWAAPAD